MPEHYAKPTGAYLLLLEFKITPTTIKFKLQVNHTISWSNNNGAIDDRATSICGNTIYPNTKCNRSAKRI